MKLEVQSVPDIWSTFVPPKIDHLSEKTIYDKEFRDSYSSRDHPKIDHIAEKTIYPKTI